MSINLFSYYIDGMGLEYKEDRYLGYWGFTTENGSRYHTFGLWLYVIQWFRK